MFPSEAVVKYLLEAGYQPNVQNEAGETPLHVAAKKVRKNCFFTLNMASCYRPRNPNNFLTIQHKQEEEAKDF